MSSIGIVNETDVDDRAGAFLEYFAERLNRVFAHFLCRFEFREDDDMGGDPSKNDRTWALHTIGNACLHETLIAIRDIDDFLTPRNANARADDLRASDFGFTKGGGFLSRTEREQIHKFVVHATTTGAENQDFRWDVWELTTKCVTQSVEFLQWVEGEKPHFRLWTAAMVARTKSQKIHDFLAQQAVVRKSRAWVKPP